MDFLIPHSTYRYSKKNSFHLIEKSVCTCTVFYEQVLDLFFIALPKFYARHLGVKITGLLFILTFILIFLYLDQVHLKEEHNVEPLLYKANNMYGDYVCQVSQYVSAVSTSVCGF
jgi:hypothetical protein